MMISTIAFSWLVGIALVIAAAAPFLLIALLLRDVRKGDLW